MENIANLSGGALLLLLVAYFLPAVVALSRRHHNATAIVVLDLLLGWTLLGWVAALIWALTRTDHQLARAMNPPQPPSRARTLVQGLILIAVFAAILIAFNWHRDASPPGPVPAASPPGVPAPSPKLDAVLKQILPKP